MPGETETPTNNAGNKKCNILRDNTRFIIPCIISSLFLLYIIHTEMFHPVSYIKEIIPQPKDIFYKSRNTTENTHVKHRDGSTRNGVDSVGLQFYLTVMKQGRLGNMMFQYASMKGIAQSQKRIPVLASDFRDLISIFPSIGKEIIQENLPGKFTKITENEPGIFQESLMKPNGIPRANVRLVGYLQSYKYFNDIIGQLRKEFTFSPQIVNTVSGFLTPLRKKHIGTYLIGIHIRRSDMVTKRMIHDGYVDIPPAYYRKAMQYFRNKLANQTLFLICSDDIGWAKRHVRAPDVMYSPFKSAGIDMGLLASTDHIIISQSTYSFWSAWLNPGIKVYYSGYPRPGSPQSKRVFPADTWPPTPLYVGMVE